MFGPDAAEHAINEGIARARVLPLDPRRDPDSLLVRDREDVEALAVIEVQGHLFAVARDAHDLPLLVSRISS